MAIYITQGRYTREAIQGMIAKPEDRSKAVAGLAKAAGAKLVDYYVTYGEYDFMAVFESGRGKGDTETMAALMAAAASGGVTDLKTTVGVRSRDAMKSMRKAKSMMKGFRAAGS